MYTTQSIDQIKSTPHKKSTKLRVLQTNNRDHTNNQPNYEYTTQTIDQIKGISHKQSTKLREHHTNNGTN